MSNLLIHTPAEAASNSKRYLARRSDGSVYGIPLGVSTIDKPAPNMPDNEFLVPVWPGEMMTVIGRPGNGKTGLMMWWARRWAKELQKRGEENRLVLYITYEQTVEELEAFQTAAETGVSITDMAMGRLNPAQWVEIDKAAARRSALPLWVMGHSYERRDGMKRPDMTVNAIEEALKDIQAWSTDKREIDMVFVDYLQRIPFAGRVESKATGHADQLDLLKNIAMQFGTRVICGVQAKREVDNQDLPIPSQDDGQWTSNIEQASDGILTVCRPRKYKNEGEPFGKYIVSGFKQMVITIAKRKLGADNFARWVEFDPRYNQLDELEEKNYQFSEGDL